MKNLRGFLVVVCLLCAIPCSAASGYLKIGGVQGDSADAAHNGWIELTSFSWGVASPAAAATAARPGAQGCATNEIRFGVRGAVIVPLQKLVLQGAPLQSVTLDVNGQQHVLDRASIASCQNNLNPQGQQTANCVMRFQRCTTHANAVTTASMVSPAALTTPNGQLLLGTDAAEEMTIVGVRQSGPNNAVLVARNASRSLMLHCASGTHYKEATITVRKAGRGQQEFMKVKLSEVFITSYQANADGSVSIGMRYGMADGSFAGFQDIH